MDRSQQNIKIIGAGIMGLSCAYALLKSGHRVSIYDPKGFTADSASPNASRVAGGMLAPYSEIEHMPPAWIKAGLEGIRLWQEHFPNLVQQRGSLMIAHEEDHYILERFRQHLPPELQALQSPQDIEPDMPAKFHTGILLEQEAHLDPVSTLSKLTQEIETLGADLRPSGYEPDEPPGDYVIDCRGYSAAQNDPDLRGVKGEIITVRNPELSLSRPVRLMHPRYPLYIVPRANHVFMIGATMIESADEQFNLRSGLELMSALYSLHPSFGEAEIIGIHAGIRPAYPDNLPRISIDGNVIYCNGLYRHGYLLAPVMAACVRDHFENTKNEFMTLFTGGQNDHHDQRQANKLRNAA